MGKNFNLEQIMPKKGVRLILLLGNCIIPMFCLTHAAFLSQPISETDPKAKKHVRFQFSFIN